MNRRTDVAVVGAGPAGLSAAIRVRFVKRFDALPLHATVIDPGPPGGLLRAGGMRILAGPGTTMEARLVLGDLMRDVERLQIPVVRDRVQGITARDEGFLLKLASGETVESGAVVLATGSRPLSNELEHLGNRVHITSKGTSHFAALFEVASGQTGKGPAAIATNRRFAHLEEVTAGRLHDLVLLVPPGETPRWKGVEAPAEVIETENWTVAETGDACLVVRTDQGRVVEVRSLLLDYLSFQGRPFWPDVHPRPVLGEGGVPRLNSHLETGVPGLFLAGDVACRYASLAAALGDGVTAGFGAYGHVYRKRFGVEPPLFAYRAPHRPEASLRRELPQLHPQMRLRWLATSTAVKPLVACGDVTLREIPGILGKSWDTVCQLIDEAIALGLVTLLPREDEDD